MTQLRPETHAHLGWCAAADFSFAHRIGLVPLATAEIARVAQVLPVLFRKSRERWQTVALMGPVEGTNVYVSRDGKWRSTFIPALLRVYPFCLDDEGQLALWSDYEPLSLATERAQPFYSEGKLTPLLQQTLNFLKAVHAGITAAHFALEAMEAKGALTPWAIQGIDTPQRDREHVGLHALNLARLEALEDSFVIEMLRNGSLRLMYAHLDSLYHADQFKALAKTIVAPQITVPCHPDNIQQAADFLNAIVNDLGDAQI